MNLAGQRGLLLMKPLQQFRGKGFLLRPGPDRSIFAGNDVDNDVTTAAALGLRGRVIIKAYP